MTLAVMHNNWFIMLWCYNKVFMANSTSWHWYLDSDSDKM